MIVRLTTAQRDACSAVGDELHRSWLDRAEPVGKTAWDAPMPPIGWNQILNRLTAAAFNPYGQRKSRMSGSFHRAVKRVATSLAHLEAHPAFGGAAMPGEHDTIFVAWGSAGAWSPYPAGRPPRLLLPQWSTVGGIRVTTWADALDADTAYSHMERPDPLLAPAEHLAFLSDARRGQADATER